MEGILEKMDYKSGLFSGSSGFWKEYYFILHEDVLMFTELNTK